MAYVIAGLVFLQLGYMIFFSGPSFAVGSNVAASVKAGTVESIGLNFIYKLCFTF